MKNVFVSKLGSDENAGTQEAPLRTIDQALQVAGDEAMIVVGPGYCWPGCERPLTGLRIDATWDGKAPEAAPAAKKATEKTDGKKATEGTEGTEKKN